MEHLIDSRLLQRRVRVHLVGVGGNGAQMAARLARLYVAMQAIGHPTGLHVTAFDADAVSESNVGRQLYSPADVGQNKALLTIYRLNMFYGLDWTARPCRYEDRCGNNVDPDILMSCVDTRSARRALHRIMHSPSCTTRYWLTAQVVLSQPLGQYERSAIDEKTHGLGCPA